MFDKYDEAWAKYQKKIRILPLPLISWDIFNTSNLEASNFNSLQKKWVNKEDYHNQIANKSVVITDKNLTILFASKQISELTGYHKSEIIGNSPKMFQGVLTSETTKNNIREAISKKHPFKEVLLNYRKDGSTYWCEIEAYPKFDKKNNLVHFIAFERIAS
ncbi:MAG: PAS domain-containing protein [Bacteroidota bacterium]